MEGSLGKDQERINSLRNNVPDAKLATYLLAPEKPRYINTAGGEVLCIPYSAANPEGAMKFLNWLYGSQENFYLAIFGVEGVDYQLIDGALAPMEEDAPLQEFFYEWMFDNASYKAFPADVSQDYIDAYLAWDEGAVASPLLGFQFNNSNVLEIEALLIEAMSTFVPIMTGFVDFDASYPELVQRLQDAGIDAYVAEVQAQIDAFLGK